MALLKAENQEIGPFSVHDTSKARCSQKKLQEGEEHGTRYNQMGTAANNQSINWWLYDDDDMCDV